MLLVAVLDEFDLVSVQEELTSNFTARVGSSQNIDVKTSEDQIVNEFTGELLDIVTISPASTGDPHALGAEITVVSLVIILVLLEYDILNKRTGLTWRTLVETSRNDISAKRVDNEAVLHTLSGLVELNVSVTPSAAVTNLLDLTISAEFSGQIGAEVRTRAFRWRASSLPLLFAEVFAFIVSNRTTTGGRGTGRAGRAAAGRAVATVFVLVVTHFSSFVFLC